MNPDRNKGGMTISSLMLVGLASAAVPIVLITLICVIVASQSVGKTFVVASAFVILLVVLAINYFVQHRVKDRILGLVDVCRDYTGGDRTVRAVVNGDDEFAMLAMQLNTLLDNQGGGNASGGASFNNGNDAATLQAQIEKLLQEVSAVGDGDLRVQAEVTPDTLGVLADSFNYMIEELAKVVGRVQLTAVQINNATRRILDGSADLAQASETQVGQIAQTTAAVGALANFIQDVAHNAQMSAEAAMEALHNAESGQQSVRQTIDGMVHIRENVQETSKKIKRLGERSNEIGEILRIIEDIADQTNLLALNAAIQSAMAGEHGRGFAVVADEIRLLAERSTESTKRIATLIKSIQGDTYEAVVAMEDSTQEVVKGSQLADEAGRALNSIYSAVARQAQMIESIAQAAQDQTSVSDAVAVAMSQISEITRRTDVGTQEAAASVSYLAELAEQLRSSVSTFRLPERANEMAGAYPGGTSVTEFSPTGNGFSGIGMDNEWSQNFATNFPPLPEPGNSGSLIALTARSGQGQYAQQDFANAPAFNGQFQFGNQPGFEANFGNQSFGGQPGFEQNFGGQPFDQGFSPQPGFEQNFGGQPFDQGFTAQPGFEQNFGGQQGFDQGFGGQTNFAEQPTFNGQPNFGEMNGFEGQQGFGGQQAFGGRPGFGGQGQNQPGFPANTTQTPMPQRRTSGGLQPSNPSSRPPRWQGQQGNHQQNQGQGQSQSQFSQDQMPYNNGQFGQ